MLGLWKVTKYVNLMLRSSFCVVKSDGFLKSLKKIETVESAVGFLEITEVLAQLLLGSKVQSLVPFCFRVTFCSIWTEWHLLNVILFLSVFLVSLEKKSPFRLCKLSFGCFSDCLCFVGNAFSFGNSNSDLQIVLRSGKRENASLSIYNAWVTRRECTSACRFGWSIKLS